MPEPGCAASGWIAPVRLRTLSAALVSGLLVAIGVGLSMGGIFTQSDSTHYLNLAAGRPAMLPFASRQLGPLLVRGLSHLPGVSVHGAFVAEGLAALALFLGTVLYLLLRSGAQRWMVVAIAGMFFWSQQFNALVLPDLFYAALLCIFLLLLRRGEVMAACAMMFPLALARESTVLTLVCFLAATWKLLRWREVLTAAVSFAAGILAVKALAANALANQEHISPALYLLAKMPWNFLKNFLGLNPWANVYPACEVPVWQHGVHLGPLRAVGYCGFESWLPVRLMGSALASFGLLPLLLVRLRKASGRAVGRDSLMLRFCLVYGLVSFCIAGALGDSVLRLFEYGWPAFFVALPTLAGVSSAGFRQGRTAALFVFLHLGLSWAALLGQGSWLLGVGIAAYVAGWFLLHTSWTGTVEDVRRAAGSSLHAQSSAL